MSARFVLTASALATALAGLASTLVAQGTGFSAGHILPPFQPDVLQVSLREDGNAPDTGKSPADLFEAAGVTVRDFVPTFVPGELIVIVELNPGTTFGGAFRAMQTFDFGAGTHWSLFYVQPQHVFCGIPEGCPGIFETSRVFNFSARAEVRTGESVTIGGLIVPGEFPRLVVIKVRGPSLRAFDLENVLANPRLALFAGNSAILANEDWTGLAAWEQALAQQVCPPPADSLEPMLVTYLDPGAYTAIVGGAEGGGGVALLEMYLLDAFRVSFVEP